MTRETKVGLVVATSFLGLVGVVVAARMSTPEISGKKRLADAQAAETKKKAESSPATDNDKKDGKGGDKTVVPATHQTTGKPGGEPFTVDLNNISNPPSVLPPTIEPKPVVVGPPPSPEEHKKVINDLKKEVQLVQVGPPPPGGPPLMPSNDPPKNVAPPNGQDKKLEVKPDSPPTSIKPDAPGVVKPPEPNNPPATITDPAANATKPPAVPGPLANNGPPANGPGEVKPPANTGPPMPVTPPDSGKPPVAAEGPANRGGPPPNSFPDPIGSKPPVSSPPISVALAAGQGNNNSLPQVKQYDVTAYNIKPEDRSFADISQKVYGSDKYAQALVLFNREDNPQAPEGIRQEPPQLRPGTAINFPPKEILENRYAKYIASPAPAGPTNPVSVLGSPTPLTAPTPGNPNTVAAPPPGTNVWTEPGGGKSYRVGNNGEHIYEIARSVLGDGGRWAEIYRLNPTVNPQFPIPAGTVLKLP
jgi:hypothetical protein